MIRKLIAALITVTLLIGVATAAFATDGGKCEHCHKGTWSNPHCAGTLKYTRSDTHPYISGSKEQTCTYVSHFYDTIVTCSYCGSTKVSTSKHEHMQVHECPKALVYMCYLT